MDHYSDRRWVGLAFGPRGHHSYRSQRGYFRPDRIFNVFGYISPGLESVDHLTGDIITIWRCAAISIHLYAGHKLDRPSVWFHIRGVGGMVDKGRKEKIKKNFCIFFTICWYPPEEFPPPPPTEPRKQRSNNVSRTYLRYSDSWLNVFAIKKFF